MERLGDATEESSRKMQDALSSAFSQALGMFEPLGNEERLVSETVFPGNTVLRDEWLRSILPVLNGVSLTIQSGRLEPHSQLIAPLISVVDTDPICLT